MAPRPRALRGALLLHLGLRAALALHAHGDAGGPPELEGPGDPFGPLRGALRAARASLEAQGRPVADLRAALRRAAGSAGGGPRGAAEDEGISEGGGVPEKNGRYEGASTLLQEEVEMLSDSQREMLRGIQAGSIGKNRVEIVLSHYNESVGWSKMYDAIITPYCKGYRDYHGGYPWTPRNCRQLPNVGREAHTFLHHIIENYDKLADWTVFTQAQAPTVGWSGAAGDRENGHVYPGVTFHDYVLGGGPFSGSGGDSQGARFVFNGHWKPPRQGLEFETVRMCFAGNYYVDMREQGKPKRLNTTCPRLKSKESQLWLGGLPVNQALLAYIDTLGAGSERNLFYSQGARFALSRERIRQRPRGFYEKLLGTLDSEVYPVAGIFAELLWYYIPGRPDKHRQPCVDHAQACPEGYEQLGSSSDHAEDGILQRLNTGSMAECAAACGANRLCESFEYHAHRPKLCVLQPSNNSAEGAQTGFWAGAVACRRTGARRP